jgi:acetyl esterase/lipase
VIASENEMSLLGRNCLRFFVLAAATVAAVLSLGAVAVRAEGGARKPQYVYKTIGDRTLMMDFDYPPEWKASDKRPAIVFFFGGGWTKGTPGQFKPQAEYFAKRGIVCARADYRVRGKDGVTPDKCVEDALEAMSWVRRHAAELGVNPDRIAAAGGSAGGHLAACTFFIDPPTAGNGEKPVSPKPNLMVLYNPALNLASLPGKGNERFVEGMSRESRERNSPLLHLRKDAPPTLVLDGTEDWLGAQTKEFVEKCKGLGVHVEAFYAEGQPHSFFNRDPWLAKTTERVDQFLIENGYLEAEPKVQLPSRGGSAGRARDKKKNGAASKANGEAQ